MEAVICDRDAPRGQCVELALHNYFYGSPSFEEMRMLREVGDGGILDEDYVRRYECFTCPFPLCGEVFQYVEDDGDGENNLGGIFYERLD